MPIHLHKTRVWGSWQQSSMSFGRDTEYKPRKMSNWWKSSELSSFCSLRREPGIKKILLMCALASLCFLLFSHVLSFSKYPSGERNTDDSSPQTLLEFQTKTTQKIKRILFWTSFFSHDPTLKNYCVTDNVLADCAHTNCEFTADKTLLNTSDAVVFHGRNLKTSSGSFDGYINLPQYRSANQLWIFFTLEAPVHTFVSLEPFDKNVFNMTMTYRPDSDIYIPYGRLVPQTNYDSHYTQVVLNSGNNTKNKRLVAWAVSNCYSTPSHRTEVVDELRKYIPVDIYGKCGNLSCPPVRSYCETGLECHEYLSSKYKFYLAFENSLCQDYITEKFFYPLYVGMVPVVYGYGDYSRVAPKGSYIDASEFPTFKSLAEYLVHLDQTPSEYEKYFEWRKYYRAEVSYFKQAWCSLCTKLWTTEESHVYQVNNLSDLWFHKSSQNVTNEEARERACSDPIQLAIGNDEA